MDRGYARQERSRLAGGLAVLGGILAVAAGIALWASEGAAVFAQAAMNAVLNCF